MAERRDFTDEQKEAARTLYEQGLGYEDISSQLGIKTGTLRAWKSREKWAEPAEKQPRKARAKSPQRPTVESPRQPTDESPQEPMLQRPTGTHGPEPTMTHSLTGEEVQSLKRLIAWW